jgi:hypothetical protein
MVILVSVWLKFNKYSSIKLHVQIQNDYYYANDVQCAIQTQVSLDL